MSLMFDQLDTQLTIENRIALLFPLGQFYRQIGNVFQHTLTSAPGKVVRPTQIL